MDVALTSLILLSVLVLSVFTIAERHLSSLDLAMEARQEMEKRMEERAKTDLSPVEATTRSDGAIVEVTLRNDGDTKLTSFDQWDVILQYTADDGLHTNWYQYIDPGLFGLWQEEWTHHDILLDSFDPDILNPGEELVIQVSVWPAVAIGTTNQATVATATGVTASTVFTR